MGKHRAEDQKSGLSTSEQNRGAGSSDRASDSKHRNTAENDKPAGSDVPPRGEGL